MMKWLLPVLVILLVILQYQLWFEDGGVASIYDLKQQLSAELQENQRLQERNDTLTAEVNDLRSGTAAIEERARNDMGMIKRGEVFYQVVN